VRRPNLLRWLWHRQHRLHCSANVEHRDNRQKARVRRDETRASQLNVTSAADNSSAVDSPPSPQAQPSAAPPTSRRTAVPEFSPEVAPEPVERHVFQTSGERPTETPFERIGSALAAGLLLGDGLWIAVVTIDRDSGLDLAIGLFTGIVLTLVGAAWLLYIVGRRQ